MSDFTEKLGEILGKLQSPKAKLTFLEQLLKQTKFSDQQDAIKSFMAHVEKEIENEKKKEIEKAKKAASEFEEILMTPIQKNAPLFEVPEQKIESIERQLRFEEPETDIKKSLIDEELGYLEKPGERPGYLTNPEEKIRQGREYVAPASKFTGIESKTGSYTEKKVKITTYTKQDELDEYVPTAELQAESIAKEKEEAYKRKKRL